MAALDIQFSSAWRPAYVGGQLDLLLTGSEDIQRRATPLDAQKGNDLV